ncbi:phage tail spike protein [Planococcus citreus]|uniref:Phage minor structural protein n=1 Tax=Planococcus citreus TaxID=1373 RepID=A0A497YGM4_9BACL|nr:phage tail spike protein [Planococcus citreus]RLJ90116.1 phage minor structural protein [Planococcus citreus]
MKKPKKILFFHQNTGKYLGTLDNRGNRRFWGDEHVQDAEDGTNYFNFFMPNNIPLAEKVVGRVRVLIPHEDIGWQEFIVHSAEDEGPNREVRTNGAEVDLNKLKIVEPDEDKSLTAFQYLELVTTGTKTFEPGIVEFKGSEIIDLSRPRGGYDFLGMVETAFNLKVRVRTQTKGGCITRRFIDLLERIGDDRSLTVEYGKDLVGFRKFVDSYAVVTSLYCQTPEREDGTRLYTTVTHAEAFQEWNWQGTHLTAIYEPESDNQEMTVEELREYGTKALNKLVASIFEYDVEAISLEHLFPHKKVRLGDRINVKNKDVKPAIYARARVLRMIRSISNPVSKRYIIGEIREKSEEEVRKVFRELQAIYSTRIIKQPNKPPLRKNAIWIQTDPENPSGFEISHTADMELGDWVRTTAIYPFEIGAEPEIPEGPTPPNPATTKKWVDTSGIIPELKMWDGAAWTAVKGPKGEDGYTPVKGTDYFDGKDGQDGSDGTSSFIWVRYSQNEDGSGMVDDPTGAKYIGVSTTEIASAPSNPSAYQWSLIKGSDGVPGEPGDDGRTSYLHIKYSNDDGSTFTTNSGETVGEWIGTYVDFTQADSASPAAYTWNKVKGERGEPGEDGYTPVKGVDYFDGVDGQNGISSYMWVKYSQYADGSFMTDDPTDARYIGVATTQTASAPSEKSAYQWTLIRGSDGIPGEPGADGSSSFLHIKYSNDGGSTFTANNGETAGEYIGQYVDFTQQDSSNPADYTWNRVKGEQGEQGPNIVDSTTQIEHDVVKANHIDVSNLSAIKANLGEVTAGIFRNTTSSNVINMDTGVINFGNGKFVVDDGDVRFSGVLSGASGTFSGEVNVGGLNDLGEGQQTLISGGRFHQETANNELEIDAHGIRIHSLNSTADERYTFWNNSGLAFNSVEAGVQHGVNYGANLVNGITYGRIYSDNEFTIDTDDQITFATNGGTDTFEFSNVESFRHALMKFGKGALKSLNGSVAGVQVRNSADTAFIPISASNIEVASDRKFKKNIEKFEGTALWDVLNTPAHAYHLVQQEDNEPKVIGLLADESPEVMRIRDETGDRISLYAQNTLLWKAMQELFELLVDTKAVNLNKVKKKG